MSEVRNTILQWNMNGFRPQKENLELIIKNYDPDIICIQETNFKNSYIGCIKNYRSVAKNRTNDVYASGGVAIYIKNKFKFTEIPLNTNMECVAISVMLPGGLTTICNIYLPNTYKFTHHEISNLINQFPEPFLFVGDFNCHSYLWGSFKEDDRGKLIERILDNPNISLLNTNQPTHFNSAHNKFSAIDLSLCSSNAAHSFDWTISDDLYGSDHFPILIRRDFSSPNGQIHNQTPKWKFAKADFQIYQELMTVKVEQMNTSTTFKCLTLNEKVNNFTELILECASASIPKSSGKSDKKCVHWWNDDCKEVLRASKRAFTRYKRHPTYDNLIEYKQLRTRTRRIFKDSKRNSWANFISSMTSSTSTTEIWKKIKKLNGMKCFVDLPDTIITHANSSISDPKIIADIFASSFANNSSDSNYEPSFRVYKASSGTSINDILMANTESNPIINSQLQITEIQEALTGTKNSSPGPDNVFNIFLKMLPPNAITYMTNLFNEILESGIYPEKWKESIIIPVPKPNRDQSNPCNYRPISLTSTLCKLMEKVVNKRLLWYLNHINFLSPFQSGFRKHRSTLDHLVSIDSTVCDAFIADQHAVAVSLDIEKAYDMVWKDRVLKILLDVGVNGHTLTFIANFLKDRLIQVRYKHVLSDKYKIENGVPQGSVLSVTLFLIAINGIVDIIPRPMKVYIFADDITILCAGKDLKTTEKLLQSLLENITIWTQTAGFKFSASKSQYIVFSKRNKLPHDMTLKLGSYQLQRVNEIKILGLQLDQELSWEPYIKSLKTECFRRINIIKSLSSQKWGADKNVILSAYKALIRSKLDYGAVVYDSAKKKLLQKLNSIHSAGLRLAIGAYRTSPIKSILVESNEEPLHIRRRKLCLSYATKILHTPENPVIRDVFSARYLETYSKKPSFPKPFHYRLNSYLKEINTELPKTITISEINPPWLIPPIKIDFSLSTLSKRSLTNFMCHQMFKEVCNKYENYVHIFTDGSRTNTGCGCAVIFPDGKMLYKLNNICSVFFCEAFAIQKALQLIIVSSHSKFLVFTDSKSVLDSLNSRTSQEPVIANIVNSLSNFERLNKEVVFVWVPSHAGIYGNDQADTAAKEAITQDEHTDFTVSHNDLRKTLHRKIRDLWNAEWARSHPNKLLLIRKDIYTNQPIHMTNRRDQVSLTRLRIGHSRLTHEHIFTKDQPPNCDVCKIPLTINHVMLECAIFQDHRQKFQITGNLEQLLNGTKSFQTIQFINSIKIDSKL